MNLKSIAVETAFAQLPKVQEIDLRKAIRKAARKKADVIIVLDDDPTGTQTVYDIPVLTTWSVDSIREELQAGSPLFYILTNSRSLQKEEADRLALFIGNNISEANQSLGKRCMVISRSDSTLRGHYPSEVEALEVGLGYTHSVNILIPAFFEGGRYTINNVHYVRQNGHLIPAAQTAYAQDRVFGYTQSDLRYWVEQKTAGAISANEVISFSIDELRTDGIEFLTQKLNACEPGTTCVVNAAGYHDLQVFALALLRSDIQPVCRTAASFVAVLAAMPTKPLLQPDELVEERQYGGLSVIGSYVPTTTRQLEHLQQHTDLTTIELDISYLLNAGAGADTLLVNYCEQINQLIRSGRDVVFYTSRDLIAANTAEENLAIGTKISGFITTIVSRLAFRPKYLIAKGGITSSEIATRSLGVKRAIVRGQILPGVPVWSCGTESRFPGLSYIVFPGNVGEADAITQVIKALA
ncbi:MAG: four-carbon acid sugar kinase family protein [Saprospiraceae bacterium]|nr:hypothetical protein [Lewinella sp.]